jgi:hypothetical protein
MIPLNEAALLLRGWFESKSRLRVIFKGNAISFSAYCVVHAATDSSVVFAIDGNESNLIEFFLAGCNCDFADAAADDNTLGFGGKIESAVVIGRLGFALTVCLLDQERD